MKRRVLTTDELDQIVKHPWNQQAVIKRVRRYYCRPMQLRGLCTSHCPDCTARLQGIFLTTRAMQPTHPMGALVWTIHERLAEMADERSNRAAEVARNTWGEPVDDNIFERLAKEYEAQT